MNILTRHISSTYDEKLLLQRAIGAVNIATTINNERVEPKHIIVNAISTRERHTTVTPENLTRLWGCGLETSKKMIKQTTQVGVRTALHPLHRRYRVDQAHLNRRRLMSHFYMDTLIAKTKSLKGNKYAQVYTNGRFTQVYPMLDVTGASIGQTLTDFSDDVGIPDKLTCDLHASQAGTKTKFMEEVRRLKINLYNIEKGRHNQNAVIDTEIRELKRRWKTRMMALQVPN